MHHSRSQWVLYYTFFLLGFPPPVIPHRFNTVGILITLRFGDPHLRFLLVSDSPDVVYVVPSLSFRAPPPDDFPDSRWTLVLYLFPTSVREWGTWWVTTVVVFVFKTLSPLLARDRAGTC